MIVPPRRRIDPEIGRVAVERWAHEGALAGPELATAVRYTLEELGARAPGRSVEVRVPPYGAVQCIEGPRHTRGTPPTVVETDAPTWLDLCTGRLSWAQAQDSGRVRASGERADLTAHLPFDTHPS